ncbi:very short patch repair endonuclease [Microbacterium lushaniae]|nr:very short patch repair endonuclease [Microbacterium lushaniae]KAA9157378.1 very short patch repair endonuclease [Microbacterium lushaniae]
MPEVQPPAASPRRRNMQANRRRDSGPEIALRSLLHAAGYRYRCDLRLKFGIEAVRPDIVFTRRHVAVFVDGCFWHSCPLHGSEPRTNKDYWAPKLARNRERDARDTRVLEERGWSVVRVWEHERAADAFDRVLDKLRTTRQLEE